MKLKSIERKEGGRRPTSANAPETCGAGSGSAAPSAGCGAGWSRAQAHATAESKSAGFAPRSCNAIGDSGAADKEELCWHQRALEHAMKRRAELVKRWGRSLNHRELLQEYVERLDEDMRWHEGRIRELGEAGI